MSITPGTDGYLLWWEGDPMPGFPVFCFQPTEWGCYPEWDTTETVREF